MRPSHPSPQGLQDQGGRVPPGMLGTASCWGRCSGHSTAPCTQKSSAQVQAADALGQGLGEPALGGTRKNILAQHCSSCVAGTNYLTSLCCCLLICHRRWRQRLL